MAKRRRNNELYIKIKGTGSGLPKKPLTFWKGLRRHREEEWDIPEKWGVMVWWQNRHIKGNSGLRPPADFMTALADSGPGFAALVDRIIDRNIRRYSE